MGAGEFHDFDRIEVRAGALYLAAAEAADAGNALTEYVSVQRPAITAAMTEVRRLIGLGQGIGAPVPTAISEPDAALNALSRAGLAGQQASVDVLGLAAELLGIDLRAAVALNGQIPPDVLQRLQQAAGATINKWNNDARRAAEDEARKRMQEESPFGSWFGDIGDWLSFNGDKAQAWLDDHLGLGGTIVGNLYGGFFKGAYDATFTKFLGGTLDLMYRNSQYQARFRNALLTGDLTEAWRSAKSYAGFGWTVVKGLPSGLWQFVQSVYHGTIGVPVNALIGAHRGETAATISQRAGEDMGNLAPDVALFFGTGGAGRTVSFASDVSAVGLGRAVASRVPFVGDRLAAQGIARLDEVSAGFSYVDRGVFHSPVVSATDDFVARASFLNHPVKYFPDGTPITDRAIVAIHGSSVGQFSVVTKVDGLVAHVDNFTPEEFAAYLRRQPGFVPGQPLTLISCESGAGPAAQRLADALGSPVRAPSNVVATDVNGTLVEQLPDGFGGYFNLGTTNTFRVFSPSVLPGPVGATVGAGVAGNLPVGAGAGG
ncbi:MAG: hypothetical protein ACOYNI_09910 [Acidimicrobiia bacterium]